MILIFIYDNKPKLLFRLAPHIYKRAALKKLFISYFICISYQIWIQNKCCTMHNAHTYVANILLLLLL